jgi:hypothetical protein
VTDGVTWGSGRYAPDGFHSSKGGRVSVVASRIDSPGVLLVFALFRNGSCTYVRAQPPQRCSNQSPYSVRSRLSITASDAGTYN